MRVERLRCAGGLVSEAAAIWRSANPSPQKIVLDYSSPNVAKQFHIGNLRSTLLGRYIYKTHSQLGDNVTGVNYLGDWGTQFALIATYWPQNRPSDAFWTTVSDSEKVKLIQQCYVVANKMVNTDGEFRERVRQTYQKMEKLVVSGDMEDEVMLLWKDIRALSKRHLDGFYKTLGITFDKVMHESDEVAGAKNVIQLLEQKNVIKKRPDGLWVIDLGFKNAKDEEEFAIVSKSDDTTLYLTRDIASILRREKLWAADKYLYVVDRSQRRHFMEIIHVLELLGRKDLADKIEHIPFGRVHGLSTRMGKTDAVATLLERGAELAKAFIKQSPTMRVIEEQVDKLAISLALDAITINDLKRARASEYEFSFKHAFSLNQNNALLLQEKHSRLCSIERKNELIMPALDNNPESWPQEESAQHLIALLEATPAIVVESTRRREPCQLTIHLIHIAQAVGKAAAQLRVVNEPLDVALPRLRLLSAARQTLADSLQLLGLEPVSEM